MGPSILPIFLLAPLLLLLARAWVSADTMSCVGWSPEGNCKDLGDSVLRVSLNEKGGAGIEAEKHRLNGIFSLDMKIPAGNSIGVNYAWYLMDSISKTNKDDNHAKIDIEIYGDLNTSRVMLATNVFCKGKQNLAQYRLPFDPSEESHTYSMQWNAKTIVWFVDEKPIRILDRRNGEPWPLFAMKPQASIWLAPWSRLKIDPSTTPMSAEYGKNSGTGCDETASDVQKSGVQCEGPWNKGLTPGQVEELRQNRDKMLIKEYGWDKA